VQVPGCVDAFRKWDSSPTATPGLVHHRHYPIPIDVYQFGRASEPASAQRTKHQEEIVVEALGNVTKIGVAEIG